MTLDDGVTPGVFLQWKGTNACLDLDCECGARGHFDGYFGRQLRCPACGTVWQMPHLFPLVRATESEDTAKDIELDNEEADR